MEKSGAKGLSGCFSPGEGFPQDASLPDAFQGMRAEEEHWCKGSGLGPRCVAYDERKEEQRRKTCLGRAERCYKTFE
jgi:hypothetical protein